MNKIITIEVFNYSMGIWEKRKIRIVDDYIEDMSGNYLQSLDERAYGNVRFPENVARQDMMQFLAEQN